MMGRAVFFRLSVYAVFLLSALLAASCSTSTPSLQPLATRVTAPPTGLAGSGAVPVSYAFADSPAPGPDGRLWADLLIRPTPQSSASIFGASHTAPFAKPIAPAPTPYHAHAMITDDGKPLFPTSASVQPMAGAAKPLDVVVSPCAGGATLSTQPGSTFQLDWVWPPPGVNPDPGQTFTFALASAFTMPVAAGGQVSFSPPSVPGDGTTMSLQSIPISSSATVGVYDDAVTGTLDGVQEGTNNASVLVYYSVADPAYASPSGVTVTAGQSATFSFTDATDGRDGAGQWSVWSTIPPASTATWQSFTTDAPHADTLTIQTTAATAPGTYAIGITFAIGPPVCRASNQYAADVIVQVEAPATPSPSPSASMSPSPAPNPTSTCGGGTFIDRPGRNTSARARIRTSATSGPGCPVPSTSPGGPYLKIIDLAHNNVVVYPAPLAGTPPPYRVGELVRLQAVMSDNSSILNYNWTIGDTDVATGESTPNPFNVQATAAPQAPVPAPPTFVPLNSTNLTAGVLQFYYYGAAGASAVSGTTDMFQSQVAVTVTLAQTNAELSGSISEPVIVPTFKFMLTPSLVSNPAGIGSRPTSCLGLWDGAILSNPIPCISPLPAPTSSAASSSPGLTFSATSSDPYITAGDQLFLTQTLAQCIKIVQGSHDAVTGAIATSAPVYYNGQSTKAAGGYLDNSDPYGLPSVIATAPVNGAMTYTSNDSPGLGIGPPRLTVIDYVIKDSFIDVLQYKPVAANSIPVPLQRAAWVFTADATRRTTSGVYSPALRVGSSSNTVTAATTTDKLPVWSGVFYNLAEPKLSTSSCGA